MVQNIQDLSGCHDSRCANFIGSITDLDNEDPLGVALEIPKAAWTDSDSEDGESFDAELISKHLRSSNAMRMVPMEQYIANIVVGLSSSQSPIRSSPETFIHALVLLEKVQHLNVMEQLTPPISRTTSFTNPVITQSTATDEKVRLYIDQSVLGERKESFASHCGKTLTDRSSRATGKSSVSNALSDERVSIAASPVPLSSRLCVHCKDARSVLHLDRSNIHLFLAAAVLISMKTREDVVQPDRVLNNVREALGVTSNRDLFLAERCLFSVLDFDTTVSISEYRSMLFRLSYLKGEAQGSDSFLSLFAL
jgi:hypothetical protein